MGAPGRSPLPAVVVLALAALVAPAARVAAAGQAATDPLPRVAFRAPVEGSLLIHGTYPPRAPSPCVRNPQPVYHARHTGTIEVVKESNGRITVIAEVPFEDYVAGIAEVPRTWPMDALKAQVVAARTYALHSMAEPDARGAALGFDICATTACQVYSGTRISMGPFGERWRQAVEETAGEILLYQGRPASTFYSSTSSGRTFGNEEIFGGDPLPYLRPTVETDDGASPTSSWQVRMPLADLARFLRAAGHWGDRPIATVRRTADEVVVASGGSTEAFDIQHFRDHLNAWAPCLDPAGYPGPSRSGSRLPQTIPSRWFDAAVDGGSAVFAGRGWGHGVGLVQWGAFGKASRGMDYRAILAHYYGGLAPVRRATPPTIRVEVATGLTSLGVAGTGGVTTVIGRRPGRGPWMVTGGPALVVRQAPAPPTYIGSGRLERSPDRARRGQWIGATGEVPQLSVASLALRVGDRELRLTAPRTVQPGQVSFRAKIPAVSPGTHALLMVVTDGVDIVRTPARPLQVVGAPSPPPPSPSPSITTPQPSSPSPTTSTLEPVPSPAASSPFVAPPGRPGTGAPLAVGLGVAGGALVVVGVTALAVRRREDAEGQHPAPDPPGREGDDTVDW